MRHQKKHGMKIGSDAAHTKAMKRNLVNSLFLNDRIKTTETRAKSVRGDVDRVVTWAKKGDLHSRRLALKKLNDKEVVREVFEKAAQGMWADRSCGFTRIIKLGTRKGDNAPIVMMELVTEPCHPKQKKAETAKAAVTEVQKQPEEQPEVEAVEEVAEEAVEAVEEKTEEKASE